MKKLIIIAACFVLSTVVCVYGFNFGFGGFGFDQSKNCVEQIPIETLSPSSYTFGQVSSGSSRSVWVNITNTGKSKSILSGIVLSEGGSSTSVFSNISSDCTGVSLQGGATCKYKIKFSPTAEGFASYSSHIDTDQFARKSVVANGVGIASISYLINQNFENNGATGYDNGEVWTETLNSGTLNSKYTTDILREAQSLYISGPAANAAFTTSTISAASTIYGHLLVKFVSKGTDNKSLLQLLDNTSTEIARIEYRSNGSISGYHGASAGINSAGDRTSTSKHLWFRYTASTGTNGVLTVWEGTDTNKPGSPIISVTAGTATNSVSKIRLNAAYSAVMIFDQVVISQNDFTTVVP